MKIKSAATIGILFTAMTGWAYGNINYEYRGGWDSFPSGTAPGNANELLHNTPSGSPFTLIDPNVNNDNLIIDNTHSTVIDFHGTLQTPQYETGQGRGQGFVFVMGLQNLTVRSGWQTLASTTFTWANNSVWSVALDTSRGLHNVLVQGFWKNASGVVSTYAMGTVDLSNYNNTTVAFGMQRQTADGERVGTFFYANGSNHMVSNSSLIAHNNGNPLGNGVLGMGPVSGETVDGNQGYYGLDNVYVYNMWTNSTAINASDLQALTAAAHLRRDDMPIPEPASAIMCILGGAGFVFRRRRSHTGATMA